MSALSGLAVAHFEDSTMTERFTDTLRRQSEPSWTQSIEHRFVLDCGAAGDLLDLHVALAPCVIGYAEIGRSLTPDGIEALAEHPYRDWIGEYAGPGYQGVATAARAHLDDLASRAMTERRFEELAKLFAQASRLEADFWQMGLDAA